MIAGMYDAPEQIGPIVGFMDEFADLIFRLIAIAFVATCIWLTVRIVNRRERWAKRLLAAALVAPVLYVASFGPACWITSRLDVRGQTIPRIYTPVVRMWHRGPPLLVRTIDRYAELGSAPNWHLLDYMTFWKDSDGSTWVGIRCQWRKRPY